MSSIDFAKALNAEQLAAVQAPDGPVLIIAAAGTGKTRTLTYRVAWLVEHQVDPRRVLLLTFTNRAAREMLDRARHLVGEGVGGLWGGTFHHMANRMLRRHGRSIGYELDYTILDQDDARSIVRSAAVDLGLLGSGRAEQHKHFPKPDVLLSLFSLSANTEQPVEDLAKERFENHPVSVDDVLRVHAAYLKRKKSLNAMDFDDLLVNGLRLFREQPSVLEHYQEHFLYILVDEYQDTNLIQAEWVNRLAERRRNLLVVGDDFQSIYSWRGADFRNILGFPRQYPEASIFKLETNYRSVPAILDVANACIAGNPEQFQKTLRAVRTEPTRPVLVRLRGGEEQARYIVEVLARLRRRGVPTERIAVLYRAHFHAMELQMELTRAKLPYVITSGVRFFEQAHVKDVCSLLRLLVNPGDELAFVRLLGLLPKVGEKTAARIWAKLGGRCDLKTAEGNRVLTDHLPPAAQAAWKAMAELGPAYAAEHLDEDPGEVIYRFVEAFYDDYAVETFENAERRLEDVTALIDYTTKYESAEAFLSETALLTNLDAEDDNVQGDPANAIHLSTIHQAKGLEWDVVFILWLAEGMFPSARSMEDAGSLSEERRLFYVATTRARDELYLCVPELRRTRDGGVMFHSPSRFVQEIPPHLSREDRVGFI